MTVDWADRDTRKLALEGKNDAILTRNLEVVELFNHNRRLGKAPGLKQVRFAVMDGSCDRSIVYDIITTARTWGLRGNNWNCEKLDQWCEIMIEQGNPKGKWLKIKLAELRTTYGTGNAVWANGAGEHGAIHGYTDPKTGDYDHIEGDKLVIRPLKWNQVSTLEFRTSHGWGR